MNGLICEQIISIIWQPKYTISHLETKSNSKESEIEIQGMLHLAVSKQI